MATLGWFTFGTIEMVFALSLVRRIKWPNMHQVCDQISALPHDTFLLAAGIFASCRRCHLACCVSEKTERNSALCWPAVHLQRHLPCHAMLYHHRDGATCSLFCVLQVAGTCYITHAQTCNQCGVVMDVGEKPQVVKRVFRLSGCALACLQRHICEDKGWKFKQFLDLDYRVQVILREETTTCKCIVIPSALVLTS